MYFSKVSYLVVALFRRPPVATNIPLQQVPRAPYGSDGERQLGQGDREIHHGVDQYNDLQSSTMTGLFSFPAYAQFQHPAAGIHKDEVIVSIADASERLTDSSQNVQRIEMMACCIKFIRWLLSPLRVARNPIATFLVVMQVTIATGVVFGKVYKTTLGGVAASGVALAFQRFMIDQCKQFSDAKEKLSASEAMA